MCVYVYFILIANIVYFDIVNPARVNGFACENPSMVAANDFFFSGLHIAGNTSNAVGSRVTTVNVVQIPGTNTLGVSMERIDCAPWGLNPPHTHTRATEILAVVKGSIEVGFVTSSPENRHITKFLQKGDVFVFPVGLVHFQRNVGYMAIPWPLLHLAAKILRVITIANTVFGSDPPIATDILSKAFQVEKKIAKQLQSQF